MNDLSSDIGLLKREFRDARTVLLRLDHQMRRLAEPSNHATPQQLLARVFACHVLGRHKAQPPARVAAERYNNDAALLGALAAPGMIGKSAMTPAMTSVSGWASEPFRNFRLHRRSPGRKVSISAMTLYLSLALTICPNRFLSNSPQW